MIDETRPADEATDEQAPARRSRSRRVTAPATAPTATDAPTDVPYTTAGGAAVAASGTAPAASTSRRRAAKKRADEPAPENPENPENPAAPLDVLAELGRGPAEPAGRGADARTARSRAAELDRLAAAVAGEPAPAGDVEEEFGEDAQDSESTERTAGAEGTEGAEDAQEPEDAEDPEDDEDDHEGFHAPEEPRLPAAALLFQAPEPRRRPRRATSESVLFRPEEGADETEEDADAELLSAEDDVDDSVDTDDSDDQDDTDDTDDEQPAANRRRRRRGGRGRRRRPGPEGDDDSDDSEGADDSDDSDGADDSDDSDGADDSDDDEQPAANRRRRRRRGGRGRSSSTGAPDDSGESDGSGESDSEDDDDSEADGDQGSSSRRRRRRRRTSHTTDDGGARARSEVTALKGSTRLEAKRQRRREGREAGRRRPIITEAEFLARRESVNRKMVVREQHGLNQIAVLEDGMLVEHYVARRTQTSLVGNVYLGRVQNVLPSMEAAFIDIGKGRNAVLYAGEVNWDAAGMDGQPRRIEQVLKSGDPVLVQVTKDPIGHKGARLTSQITLAGRYLVLVPSGAMTGISRKLPEPERARLKRLLKQIVPDDAGVIVRTAAEGASEEHLRDDVERLMRRWRDIEAKSKNGKSAPTLLKGEPELAVRVVRDVFNEDFESLTVSGDEAWATISSYVRELSPDLADRMHHWTATKDVFSEHRIDEQLAKGMDRKVWLPSGGSLVIDRTEAMTVVDVNTGKFTGSGGTLEETVTKNNLEAAEEIVRQLRLRDIGGIIVIDFIDMVLESNRDLVLRRLVECLGRDRTRHQVAEVTSLGLVQMTRKRVGQGLVEAFSTPCEHCAGRGFVVHEHPVETGPTDDQPEGSRRRGGRRGGQGTSQGGASQASSGSQGGSGTQGGQGEAPVDEATQAARDAVKATLATIAAAAASAHHGESGAVAAGQKALELAKVENVLPAITAAPEPEPEPAPVKRTRRGSRRATAPAASPDAAASPDVQDSEG